MTDHEEFVKWLDAEPGDVGPQDFLRVIGMGHMADYDYAVDPETVERFRQEMGRLHFDLVTGRVGRESQEYATRMATIFEPLDASVKLALEIEEFLS